MMFMKLLEALKVGKELADPAKWKKGQWLITAVGTVVAGVITAIKWKWPEFSLPAGLEDYIVEVIVGVLCAVNLYLIPATTKKVGTKDKDTK
jgi:hypothetical protein